MGYKRKKSGIIPEQGAAEEEHHRRKDREGQLAGDLRG